MTACGVRDRVLALLRRHGRDAVSFQVLEPGLDYWFDGDDACVAHAVVAGGRAWVAAGGPIAARDAEVGVMDRFVAAARSGRRRACFFGIERDVSRDGAFAVLHVGEQPVWDPRRWSETLAGRRSLREQLRRARAKGVTVRVAGTDELRAGGLRPKVDALIDHWLATRAMAPMQFVVSLAPYDFPEERRFLVAERGGELVGILVAVPIYARGGYLLEDVLRDPAAPNGTIELLFDHAMRLLAAEGCDHATFGLAPLAGVDTSLLRFARVVGRPLYDFSGLLRFKRKLGPHETHDVWIAYPRGSSRLLALLDVLRAFAGGSLVRFGIRTLAHRARDVARWLALLLALWIVVLALAPTDRWFPSIVVQLAWILLDLGILATLCALARRWRPRLAAVLAVVALADFAFGLWQALAWNLARVSLVTELVVVAGALVAPLVAVAFLLAARAGPRAASQRSRSTPSIATSSRPGSPAPQDM